MGGVLLTAATQVSTLLPKAPVLCRKRQDELERTWWEEEAELSAGPAEQGKGGPLQRPGSGGRGGPHELAGELLGRCACMGRELVGRSSASGPGSSWGKIVVSTSPEDFINLGIRETLGEGGGGGLKAVLGTGTGGRSAMVPMCSRQPCPSAGVCGMRQVFRHYWKTHELAQRELP